MGRVLPFADQLYRKARDLERLGLRDLAARIWKQLGVCSDLSPERRRRVHLNIARYEMRRRRYAAARKWYRRALQTQPGSAHCCYGLARAIAKDPTSDPVRAAIYLKKAVRLRPDHHAPWIHYARFQLGQGEIRQGLKSLQRAFKLAPENPKVVCLYLKVLARLRRFATARRIISQLQFRLGHMSWFRFAVSNFKLAELSYRQALARQTAPKPVACVLPFRREVGAAPTASRLDKPVILATPHLADFSRESRRFAQ